jgi:Asp-tRNA(Asn)/Glu-tRNA(Gln) amidotransferase A subunit family amidase
MKSRNDAVSLAERIRLRELSAGEACEVALERAAGDGLGCFWEIGHEKALADAAEVDVRLDGRKPVGRLAGVPFAVKDCFDVRGFRTTLGVPRPGATERAQADAAAVARLRRSGAVVIGKTAMHQLAWGMSGQAPGFPVCRNPLDPTRQPGGSSSGSAVAVSAGIVPLGLGTDAGGSVRQPAAWCGVVGFKPTLGAVSLEGCAPMARSLDTFGVLARSVRDCREVLTPLVEERPTQVSPARIRVGLLEGGFNGADPAVEHACREALAVWEEDATVLRLELPWERRFLSTIYATELAETWGDQVDADPALFGEDVKAGIAAGRAVERIDYLAALRTLERLQLEATHNVADLDVVACPTSPILPPSLSEPDAVRLAGRNTRVFNALGWPSISIPCGKVGEAPVGLMVASPRSTDGRLLAVAERLGALLA